MNDAARLSMAQHDDNPDHGTAISVSVPEEIRSVLEMIETSHRQVRAKLFESLLISASIAQSTDDSPEHERDRAEEWKSLTDEIIRLEEVRRQLVVSDNGKDDRNTGSLEQLVRVHEAIRDCEVKLDRLLMKQQQPSTVCGLSDDHG